jgi:hypothetical protein
MKIEKQIQNLIPKVEKTVKAKHLPKKDSKRDGINFKKYSKGTFRGDSPLDD